MNWSPHRRFPTPRVTSITVLVGFTLALVAAVWGCEPDVAITDQLAPVLLVAEGEAPPSTSASPVASEGTSAISADEDLPAKNQESKTESPLKPSAVRPARESKPAVKPEFYARYERESQLLIIDVLFEPKVLRPIYMVTSDFAFITDAKHPVEGIDIQQVDGDLIIDLSRGRQTPLPRIIDEFGDGPRVTTPQTFPVWTNHSEPYFGISQMTYVFRFPLHTRKHRYQDPPFVTEAPRGKLNVKMIFGYGSKPPSQFLRSRPKDEDPEAIDKALSEEWQHRVTTEPVLIDFGGEE